MFESKSSLLDLCHKLFPSPEVCLEESSSLAPGLSWPVGYPVHPPLICAFDNYAVHMSTEVYCIFGVILTRMEESGALLAPK